MTSPAIGIDLGTTHCVVAAFDEGPRVLRNELGDALVPSVLAIDGTGHVVVGRPALERAARGAPGTVARFKSHMGSGKRLRLGDRTMTPTSLSAVLLRELKGHAEAALGLRVEDVVITVPAWFGEGQRRATIEAAHLAGLSVLRLVNEPTAAALAYGLGIDPDPLTVAIIDLGGGTFDVTILDLMDGVADVLSSVGDVHLGGEDATDAVVRWYLGECALAGVGTAGPVRVAAERAKRQLSSSQAATVDSIGGPRELDLQTFSTLTKGLQQRMARCMRQALVRADLRAGAVDEVRLVGGATRMPWVPDLVASVFGTTPAPAGNVDETVALGAAVQAGLVLGHRALRERLATDVLTHSLGVATRKYWGSEHFDDRFDPILARGTTLPATRTNHYYTLHPQQESVRFRVYEGEARIASDNQLLGELLLEDLPPHEDESAREEIAVRFTHDPSGLLEVEARLTASGRAVRHTFQRGGVRYSPEDRRRALEELAGLRVHPRELLPNRLLVERAGRVIELLAGGSRHELDQLLDGFEVALERGDPQVVELMRARLRSAIEDALARADLRWEDL